MVITGVAGHVPDRNQRLVYVDALLPENDECANDTLPPKLKKPGRDGYLIPTWVTNNPPPPHDVPTPANTFSQPIILTKQSVAGKLAAICILTLDKGTPPEQDDYHTFYLRAQARGCPALIMEGDHKVRRYHPHELVKLLEQAW